MNILLLLKNVGIYEIIETSRNLERPHLRAFFMLLAIARHWLPKMRNGF